MQLTCNKCNHQWEEEVPPDQPVVMCPECLTIVPMVLAQKGTAQPSEKPPEQPKPPPTKTPTPPPSTPGKVDDIHELKTMKVPPTPSEDKPPPPPAEPKDATRTPPPDIHDQRTHRIPPTPSPDEEVQQLFREDLQPIPQAEPPPSPEVASQPSDVPTILPGATKEKTIPMAGAPVPVPAELKQLIGRTLAGYRVEDLLGKGGMGAVFLAHQMSLDRKVAIKVLPTRFSQNPELTARFTREALTAAQLNHHNIIQVFDVGSVGETNFISMEYVRGKNIGQMIRDEGRLRFDDAAAYILQAARGLRYAHQRGIIHRDIKPDNLMINEHGIVKIADMGLAKWRGDVESTTTTTPDSETLLKPQASMDLTMDKQAVGTPAYMSPEQGQDSSKVDERTDQYSLGCTLYYMCAGKAPYSGTTAFELISKHMKEPLTPLEVHVQGVSPAFSEIIKRMLEKQPESRYPNMDAVINDLEAYLGVESEKGPYTPREYHLALLEEKQKDYYSAPSINKRKFARSGFFAFATLCFLLSLLAGDFTLAGGFLGLLVLTPVASFIVNGIITKEYLFRRVRNVFFSMPLRSWLTFAAGSIVALVILYLLGWLYLWLGSLFIVLGISAAYQTLVLKRLRAERLNSIENVQDMLKQLRIRGVSEDALHDFVSRFSGIHWEEFFEELFGYEEMISARTKSAVADKVKARKKYAIWREPLANWLESIERARKRAREKRQLAKAEARRLKARGISEKEAQKAGELEATRIIEKGLIKEVPSEKPVAKKPALHLGKNLPKLANIAFRTACFIGGLAVMTAALAYVLPAKYGISALNTILPHIPISYYTQWGWGGTEIAAVAGLLLLLMTFASRPALRALVLLGVIMLLLKSPIIALVNQPQLTETRLFFGGIALIIVGFGYSALAMFQFRGKF